MQENYRNIGYRDGLAIGKALDAQNYFNEGYEEGAPIGFKWGQLAGIVSSLNLFYANREDVPQPLKKSIDDLHQTLVDQSQQHSNRAYFLNNSNPQTIQQFSQQLEQLTSNLQLPPPHYLSPSFHQTPTPNQPSLPNPNHT
uniref:Essential protein Yae1 N-terminal domain-containing protein n=1 Tax=Arcella intermedia TaxID=1963864 RepID=A0A6B2LMA7_9EUKA